jgi:signal transduction histidine kinase
MMMIGPDDRLVRANLATQDLFSRSFAQLVGARADDMAATLLGASDPLRLARTRRSGKPFRGDARATDGRWFALAVDPIAAPPGTWAGAVCRLRDISERRRADQLLRRSLRQVRHLAAHLQEAREEERGSIADQIHHQLVHDVTAIKLDLAWLRSRLSGEEGGAGDDGEPLEQRVDAMTALADRCLKTLRRISSELRPDLLLHFGPSEAIEWQAEELRLQTGVRTRLDLTAADLGLSATTATALFRIVQAALENVVRHAEADEVKISLRRRGSNVVLSVADDGRGFDPRKIAPASFGLIAMRERALALGGDLSIESRPRRGTTVTARLPIV